MKRKRVFTTVPADIVYLTLRVGEMAREETLWDTWCPMFPGCRFRWRNYERDALNYYERYPETVLPAVPVKLPRCHGPSVLTLATPELEALAQVYRSTWFAPPVASAPAPDACLPRSPAQ